MSKKLNEKKEWLDCTIYTIDELKNKEFTEKDLCNLFDTSSLISSLIIHEFRLINDNREDWEIIKMAKTENGWPDKYRLSKKKYDKLIKDLQKVFENVYQYREKAAKTKAEWWMFKYGFRYKD